MTAQRRPAVGIAAVLLLAVIFLIGIALDAPSEPGAILYAIPVVLIAIAIGPAAGAVAGAAAELNDEVVRGLALAGYLLSAGDAEAATTSLRSTLGRAQRIVGELIEPGPLEAGRLRRDRAADVG